MKKILLPLALIVFVGAFVMSRNEDSPKVELSLSPTPAASTIPEGWQTYQNELYNYSISYPQTFEQSDNGSDSIQLIKKTDEMGAGPANFMYVSVVPKNETIEAGQIYNYNEQQFNILNSLEIGENKTVADVGVGQEEWFTYERLPNRDISGYTAKVFVNRKPWEFPTGTTEYFNFLETPDSLYIIGGYIGAENTGYSISENEYQQILATFTLSK